MQDLPPLPSSTTSNGTPAAVTGPGANPPRSLDPSSIHPPRRSLAVSSVKVEFAAEPSGSGWNFGAAAAATLRESTPSVTSDPMCQTRNFGAGTGAIMVRDTP